jgi:hypothetical protein
MTRIKGPVLPIADVQALVARRCWALSSTARKDLVAHFGSFPEAARAAQLLLSTLTSSDYDHSVHLPNPPADCDVYGITTITPNPTPPPTDIETPWYIKFYEDVEATPPYDEFLNVVSFHDDRPPGLLARRKVKYP